MKLLISSLLLTVLAFSSQAQFCIGVSPQDTTYLCPGDSILISANEPGSLIFDFNNGLLPEDWSITGSATFTEVCGPGIDLTGYYWASTSSTEPQISTATLNVICGGNISFDMKYAVQSGAAPCEGPDLENEGVELQYSLNNGATWFPITYFSPGGFQLAQNPGTSGTAATGTTPYTSWNSFNIPIPVAAQTPNTMFRWFQEYSSGTCCDNWGIDNIYVDANECDIGFIDWDNDAIEDSTSFWYTLPSIMDTFFVADVYDTNGIYSCSSDTIYILPFTNTMTYDLTDTLWAYCPTDSLEAVFSNFDNAPGPYSITWSNGDTTDITTFGTNGNGQDIIEYYIDISDGCGYTNSDTVIMVVNQTLAIDTMLSFPANACDPTGAVTAFTSGETTTSGQPFYNWTGPGQSGLIDFDATAVEDIPPGWYYFTVIDDVCEATDSIYVDIENAPQIDITPTVSAGCGPLVVNFNSTSSPNIETYYWDFGDGTPTSTNENPSHSFDFSSSVMAIGYDATGCADTAYATVTVEPCGCTDPTALNYNPNATIDNGSCAYPFPTVEAPNIFTPNGDEENDLYFLTVTNASDIHLVILNRWGNVVFDQKGPNPAWDGTMESGVQAKEGTYFYRYTIYGVTSDIEPLEGHGFVQLVRH